MLDGEGGEMLDTAANIIDDTPKPFNFNPGRF